MTTPRNGDAAALAGLCPRHDSFVGVDSDGCVFDTMELKQKRCFHPEIVRHWRLEPIERWVRETAEFVNLYSRWRGRNRFLSLVDTFDILRARPEVAAAGVALPGFRALRRWIAAGRPLGNDGLAREAAATGDPELADVLAWSEAVNARVAREAGRVPAFAWARRGIERMRGHSDVVVVSQTPAEALRREWRQSGLDAGVAFIAGQELGTKAEHLVMATRGRYGEGRVLMLGDAPGDREAATASGALFYPINPGREEASWQRFCEEAYGRFLAGRYAGDYERALVEQFEALLPDRPPFVLSNPGPPPV